MHDEVTLALIKQSFSRTKCFSATAREVGVSRRSVSQAVARNFERLQYKRRVSARVSKRRTLLRRLSKETGKKEHLTFPKYSSASRFREALQAKTAERLSIRHVRRELRAAGLRCYVRPPHATRSSGDIRKKAAFAAKYRHEDWRRIVFSDESWLTANERTGKCHWTDCRKNVIPIEKKARWNIPSIMVWGTVGYNWKGPLIVFPSKMTVDGERRQFRLDAAAYVRRCLSAVAKDLKEKKRLFQQDGARSHAAKSTAEYLLRKQVDFIPDWPPYSPELNAIERIWKELNERVGRKNPRTQEALIAAALEAWEELPQEVINAHCAHFHSQLLAFSPGR